MTGEPYAQHGRAGLSLVELLVVIAILLCLAGILLPALSRSRSRTRALQCLNNTRQMIFAWQMYLDDNANRLAPNPAGSSAADRGYAVQPTWVTGWLDFDPNNPANTNIDFLLNPGKGSAMNAQGALLGPYVRSAAAYKCPADDADLAINGRRVARVRSCSMNCAMDGNGGPWIEDRAGKRFRLFHFSSEIPAPAQLWVLLDQSRESLNDGWFVAREGPAQSGDLPAASHENGCGFAFADGHSLIKKWKSREQRPSSRKNPADPAAAVSNEDLLWVADTSTVSF